MTRAQRESNSQPLAAAPGRRAVHLRNRPGNARITSPHAHSIHPVVVALLLLTTVTSAAFGLQLRVRDGKLTIVQPGAASQASASQPDAHEVLVPSQGRPIFNIQGQPFSCLLQLSSRIGPTPRFWLQNSLFAGLRYPLLQPEGLVSLGDGYARVQLVAPAGLPTGLYNLIVAGSQRETVSPRSVCVIPKYKTSFRFVHLSNMNIGDPTAVQFDPRLPEEINLLAPEFIIATGDYTEWARLADSPGDWQYVLDYMARFDAPVFMLCGDHDHQATFTRCVANSLIGTLDYGNYHGLLLLDHGYHPIEQDDEQIRWIVNDLAENGDKTFNFIVTHSDELGLVRRLKEMDLAEKVFRDGKVKMLICGGHTDWDYSEFSSVLSGLPSLNFIRTAQSSTALCDRASGISHYRVIEINGDRVSYVCPDDTLNPRLQNSVAAGHIAAVCDGPNDGSREVLAVNVANTLPRPWQNCRVWLQIRKDKLANPPAVAGCRLVQYLDLGKSWAVQVEFDLPDKGAVTVQAGPENQLEPPSPVRLEILAPNQLGFMPRQAGFGLTYFTCQAPVVLRVTNRVKQPAKVWPVVRLNGANLPISSPEPLPMTIAAGDTQLLRVGLTLGQAARGLRTLQAYLLDDPLRRLTTQQVALFLEPEGTPTQAPSATSQPNLTHATTQPATQPRK